MSNKLSQSQIEDAAQLAKFVVENGRVGCNSRGNLNATELALHVEYEASLRGADDATAIAMGKAAKQFAK